MTADMWKLTAQTVTNDNKQEYTVLLMFNDPSKPGHYWLFIPKTWEPAPA